MWAFITFIATALFSFFLRPSVRQQKQEPASKVNIPQTGEGKSVPVVFGTVKIKNPHIVWYGDVKAVALRRQGNVK